MTSLGSSTGKKVSMFTYPQYTLTYTCTCESRSRCSLHSNVRSPNPARREYTGDRLEFSAWKCVCRPAKALNWKKLFTLIFIYGPNLLFMFFVSATKKNGSFTLSIYTNENKQVQMSFLLVYGYMRKFSMYFFLDLCVPNFAMCHQCSIFDDLLQL